MASGGRTVLFCSGPAPGGRHEPCQQGPTHRQNDSDHDLDPGGGLKRKGNKGRQEHYSDQGHRADQAAHTPLHSKVPGGTVF